MRSEGYISKIDRILTTAEKDTSATVLACTAVSIVQSLLLCAESNLFHAHLRTHGEQILNLLSLTFLTLHPEPSVPLHC